MTEVTLNQEDHSYMFDDETTPVKACSELNYQVITGFGFLFPSYHFLFLMSVKWWFLIYRVGLQGRRTRNWKCIVRLALH